MRHAAPTAVFCLQLAAVAPVMGQDCSHHATETDCVPVEQWSVHVAMGYGAIGNPVRGGQDIPLVLIPDISYYGEHWFIDNRNLGYTFYTQPHLTLSAITGLNEEFIFLGKRIKWLILPLHESETDRHLIGLSG